MLHSVWLLCNWADVIILSGFPVISSISSSHSKTSHRSELYQRKKNNIIISDVQMEKVWGFVNMCNFHIINDLLMQVSLLIEGKAFSWSTTASEAALTNTPKGAVTTTTGQ